MTADLGSDQGPTHYDVLGVPRDADRQEIARAYRAAMRRLHPDAVGGEAPVERTETADELIAVQAAWRVLGDPEARVAYDRELGSSADLWDDLGWGAAVGDPEHGAAAPRPDADEPPTRRPRPAPGPVPAPSAEPWRTPYAPGAVRVPEPVLPEGPPTRSALDWAVIAAAGLLGAATVGGIVEIGLSHLVGVGAAVGYVALLAGIVGTTLEFQRGDQARAAGFAITVFWVVLSPGVPFRFGTPATVVGGLAAAAIAAGVWAVRRRRRAVRRRQLDRTARVNAYHGAVEWNRVREALRAPGSHVERCSGVYNSDDPRYMRAVHPETGEETIRETGRPLPRHAWIVVADDGEVLCAAPPGALDAWLACWPAAETAAAR